MNESSLNLHKSKLLGVMPKSKDDFNSVPLLSMSKLDGGDQVVFLDTNVDLPDNWRDIDMIEEFGIGHLDPEAVAGSEGFRMEDRASSDGGSISYRKSYLVRSLLVIYIYSLIKLLVVLNPLVV